MNTSFKITLKFATSNCYYSRRLVVCETVFKDQANVSKNLIGRVILETIGFIADTSKVHWLLYDIKVVRSLQHSTFFVSIVDAVTYYSACYNVLITMPAFVLLSLFCPMHPSSCEESEYHSPFPKLFTHLISVTYVHIYQQNFTALNFPIFVTILQCFEGGWEAGRTSSR